MRKSKKYADEPSIRDRLGADFVRALEADFQVHGINVIEQLREKSPEKYIEAVARLTPPEPIPVSPYAETKSVRDVGRVLLQQVGMVDFKPTTWQTQPLQPIRGLSTNSK
jgi:hypothetical protein